MKAYLVAVFLCICATHVCTGFKTFAEVKKHCDEHPDDELTESEIRWDKLIFNSVACITPQALADFKLVTKKQCLAYYPLSGVTSFMPFELRKCYGTVTAAKFHDEIKNSKFTASEINQLVKDLEEVPADRLEPELRNRLITYFKGFSQSATLEEVNAMFVYVFGSTEPKLST